MTSKISVIIPVYNGEKTIKDCLNSVLRQSYKNYEVIMVDNNSTDRTNAIIKEFQKKSKKIRYLFEGKKGRGAARYKGEISSKGEIILMTDVDCIVPREWIKEMILAIEGYDAVQGFEEPVFDNFWSRHRQISSERKYGREKMRNPIGKIDTKNFGIRKSILKKVGFTSRKYFDGNDTELSIKLFKNNCKVRFMKDIMVKHFHPDSLRKVFKRHICRGKWIVIISRDYLTFLKQTSFLRDTCQTPRSFFEFFPGIFGTLVRKGFEYTFYDFIMGISWRIGLVYSWIKNEDVLV